MTRTTHSHESLMIGAQSTVLSSHLAMKKKEPMPTSHGPIWHCFWRVKSILDDFEMFSKNFDSAF